MTKQNESSSESTVHPFSDEYVNAVIQRHGYQSAETVIARLYQWIGRHGGENGITLLMYEAHKALSKLRAEGLQAGVPLDERAAFEHHARACELTRDEDVPDDYRNSHVQEYWNGWKARAALASAPVADGESQPIAVADEVISKAWINVSDSYGIAYNGPSYVDAAPQAGSEPLARYCPGCGSVGPVGDEYRDCCPDGNQARMIPARLAEKCRDTFRLAIQSMLAEAAANDSAAPQASEAVRILFPAHLRKMWSGGEVQAWLDEHQGITPPKASAKGSMERYRNWQSEQTQADKDGCANG